MPCEQSVLVDYAAEIELCKQRLAETDYAAIKIAKGAASHEEYAELLAERRAHCRDGGHFAGRMRVSATRT